MADEKNMLDPRIVEKIWDAPRLSDRTYWAIRDAIASGRIKPGEWLREEALTQELGVSRITVRDALQRLVASGLAVHEPYKGVRLLKTSIEEVEEMDHIRLLLEGWAMELAASRITDEELAKMEELLPSTVAGDDPTMIIAAREANKEFHWIAINASQSHKLIFFLKQVWELTFTHALRKEASLGDRIQSSKDDMEEHERILQALKERDGIQARIATEDHIKTTIITQRHRMSKLDLPANS